MVAPHLCYVPSLEPAPARLVSEELLLGLGRLPEKHWLLQVLLAGHLLVIALCNVATPEVDLSPAIRELSANDHELLSVPPSRSSLAPT